MNDLREKVIYSIERCICHVPDACRDCAYDAGHLYPECFELMMKDAISLLKAQEPRVMTVEEAQQAEEGTVVWFEQPTPERDYMSPMVSTGDGCIGNLYLGINLQYVKDGAREYRLWSGKPTDAQREATQWAK